MARKKQKSKSKSTKVQPSIETVREKREKLRQEAATERRNQNRLLVGFGVVLVLLAGGLVYAAVRPQIGVANELSFPSQGNNHIEYGQPSPIAYNSTPPNSGPHYGGLAQWAVHEEPIRYEQLIHNMEDGGVIIYYQCEEDCPELAEQLRDSAQPYIDAGRHVAVVPNRPEYTVGNGQTIHEDMEAKIALTAWTKVLKMDEYDADAINQFIVRYEGIDNHNAVASR